MSRFSRLFAVAALLAVSSCATRPRGAPPPPLVDDRLYSCHENSETDGKTVNAGMDCTVSLQADPAKFRAYIEEHSSKLCKGLSRYIVTEYRETAPPLDGDAAKFRHVDVKIQCQ